MDIKIKIISENTGRLIDEIDILNAKNNRGSNLTPEELNAMTKTRGKENLEFNSEYTTAIVPNNVVCAYNKISAPIGGGRLIDVTLIVSV